MIGSPVVKDVVEDLKEYLENVVYLKGATTSSLKHWRSRGVFIKYREHSMDSQRRLFGDKTTPLKFIPKLYLRYG